MGWSCYIEGKNKVDLMKKYKIPDRLSGLAPDCSEATDAHYRLNDIRNAFSDIPFKDEYKKAAQQAIITIMVMLKSNLESLHQSHCETCKCDPIEPEYWDVEAIKRFLDIPINEVYRCGGGW